MAHPCLAARPPPTPTQPKGDHIATIAIDAGDAAELAEILRYIAGWIRTLADNNNITPPICRGNRYTTDDLHADLTTIADQLETTNISP